MNRTRVLDGFAALANGDRLDLIRSLVIAGEGVSAGDIARSLGMSASRLSFHLSALEQAGLVTARRDGRKVFYSADHRGIDRLVGYLLSDCCSGANGCGERAALRTVDFAHELDGG